MTGEILRYMAAMLTLAASGARVCRGRHRGTVSQRTRERRAQADVAGRMSACSCERLREIGDGTPQFVVFQFKERGDCEGQGTASDTSVF